VLHWTAVLAESPKDSLVAFIRVALVAGLASAVMAWMRKRRE
jgi:hypothetical protein